MVFTPNVAIAPGRTIQNEIINLDMTQREFAERLWISEKHLSQLINWKVWLTFDLAQKLERITKIKASFWNKLEIKYQEDKSRLQMESSLIEQKALLTKFTCYSDLVKLWFIESTRKPLEKIKNLCNFLNIVSLDTITDKEQKTYMAEKLAFRKSSVNELSQENLACRIKAWEKIAIQQEVWIYEKNWIEKIIPHLKKLTKNQKEIDFNNIKSLLNSVWIYFAKVDHFHKVPVNGISRIYKGKPFIQMSIRQKWLDVFWFTLFHELGHVYHWDLKKENIIVDVDNNNQSTIEKKANDFAQKNLISEDKYAKHITSKKNITNKDIDELAKIEWIWSNIIAGRVAHDYYNIQKNIWSVASKMRPTIQK